MNKPINRLCLIIVVIYAGIFAQQPQVSLENFIQYSFPLVDLTNEFYGNVSNPAWSTSDDYIAVTLSDPDNKMRHVVIYNNKRSGEPTRINTALTRSSSGRRTISNDTHQPLWSPLQNNVIYVISRIKRNDYLYKISLTQTGGELKVDRMDRLYDNYTPVINYTFSNKSGGFFIDGVAYLILHSGTKENLDIALFNADNTVQKTPPKINNEKLSEYASDCYINANEISIVIQGFDNNQDDIYQMQGTMHQLGMSRNITNSSGYNERLPKFNRNGTLLAYLRSQNTAKDEKKDELLIHSLHVYDLENRIDIQLDNNVFVVPDIFNQTPYIWIDENTIICIDNNFEEKYPLIAINVLTGEKRHLKSPLINHKELAISSSGKRLGLIAKGQDDNPDMDFDKLYICDVKY